MSEQESLFPDAPEPCRCVYPDKCFCPHGAKKPSRFHRHRYRRTSIHHPTMPLTWQYACRCGAARWEIQDVD